MVYPSYLSQEKHPPLGCQVCNTLQCGKLSVNSPLLEQFRVTAKVAWFLCFCLQLVLFIMTTPTLSTESSMTPAISNSDSDPVPLTGTSTGGRTNSGIIPLLVSRTSTETVLPHRLADEDVQRVAQAIAQMIGRSSQNPISSTEGSFRRQNEG